LVAGVDRWRWRLWWGAPLRCFLASDWMTVGLSLRCCSAPANGVSYASSPSGFSPKMMAQSVVRARSGGGRWRTWSRFRFFLSVLFAYFLDPYVILVSLRVVLYSSF
jgi:hypothetical protein